MTAFGEVAEWLKAAVSKTAVGATPPWVRIPPSPPSYLKFPLFYPIILIHPFTGDFRGMRLKIVSIVLSGFLMLITSVAYPANFVLVIGPTADIKKPSQTTLYEAEKLFVRLLEKGDRLSVIKFADEAIVLSELVDVKANRFSLLRALGRTGPESSYSNIYDALLKAKNLLQKEPSEKRTVILLTSRGMNLKAEDKNEEYSLKLLDELLPEFKKKGIRVYTIALSINEDTEFLKEIAHETLGLFYSVKQTGGIFKIFSDIFANIKLSDEIPIKDGQFFVDREVKKIKVVLGRKDSKATITLLQPDGRKVTYKRHPSHYKWYSTGHYELAIITRPLPGKWKIIYASDSDSRVFINSTLEMKITDIPRVAKTGRKQKLYMWLQKDDRILKNTSLVLRAVEFNIRIVTPEGKNLKVVINDNGTEDDDLAKDGVYTGSFVPEQKGEYIVKFLSEGKNFYREKIIKFYAKEMSRVQEKTPADKKQTKKAHVKSNSSAKEEVLEKDYSLKKALIKFAIFNAILISLAGICLGVVLFLRKKKAKETEEEESED